MVSTFVIRLIADQLQSGRFVGEIEHIASGRCVTVRSLDELERFARGTSDRRGQGLAADAVDAGELAEALEGHGRAG